MPLDLAPEVEIQVREDAACEGMSASDYVAALLKSRTSVADPTLRVRQLIDQWQKEDKTPLRAEIDKTESLFQQWAKADAALTHEEREAEDILWETFTRNVNETRATEGRERVF